MSYPDLGCFSECLECELCEDVDPGAAPPPELFPGWESLDSGDPPDGGPFGSDGFWAPTPSPSSSPSLLDSVKGFGGNIFGSGLDLGAGIDVGFPIRGTSGGFHIGGHL